MGRINVTKTFLPPQAEYDEYLKQIWESDWLTNQGPLLKQLQEKLETKLAVPYLHFVANGTLALQVAIRALDITEGEIITTPFSYVATISSILWERCTPVFVDIDPKTLCINADKIEAAITNRTKAIMPVHVFGIPCDVDAIRAIAIKHNQKVIYDGAHAFGVTRNGTSLLKHGDISICSFHATKLFHTIEGGCIITEDKEISDKVELIKRFGHNYDTHFMLGMNAKANEFQAAMGLCNLKYIDDIIAERRRLSELYDKQLKGIERPEIPKGISYNYAYYPVLMNSEQLLLKTLEKLAKKDIYPRRYFYPSLNTLPYLKSTQACPESEDIARRIMCLPLYVGLKDKDVANICEVVSQ